MARPILLIIYHSQTDNTAKLARAALAGAAEIEETETRLQRAFDTSIDDFAQCDGVLFGTPENFGNMSGALKDFFDRCYYPMADRRVNLPYGIFISCGNDGSGAVREIERIAKGFPLKPVVEPLVVKGQISESDLTVSKEMGQTLAAGIGLGIF